MNYLLLLDMESIILFSLCYILFCICFVFAPPEFVSVGLTVESLLSFWVKNESDSFIHHHIRRTVATLFLHSCIPLGYFLGIKYVSPENSIWNGNIVMQILVVTSLTVPIIVASIACHWNHLNWKNHPIAKKLKNFTAGDTDLNQITKDIDNEFRRVDKIIIKCNALTKVVATDNWIIKIMPYSLDIAHQSDATLVVSSSVSHLYVPDRPEGRQYLIIDVKSSRPNVGTFQIRINSSDFKDLQEKMVWPISILENVVVHGNLTDCFLKVFKEEIKRNPKVPVPHNLDVCIGCLLTTPNVKLMTTCGHTSGPEKCSMCYCRPLWCVDCMGKWFASRQDQNKPETWLSSKCVCPMCRSTFCILDVCLLSPTGNETNQE